ncbi:MAG: Sir2 silent information regulator family NAD-dependent deacetylase [Clostridia bacterium]|nr:Sir2 silent information regulator family NAD-dependent deacetylase [Clostridia bacterium]
MKKSYHERIEDAKKLIENADYVLIGAGAGLSIAGGFTYSGERFEKYFSDFIDKYGFKDMYSGGFYPFASDEERWAYWSRYVYINRYLETEPNPIYKELFELVKNKKYFVITTNVDHQFQIAGFDKKKLYYMQGDYGLFQCSVPCHDKTYDNKELILKMVNEQKNGKIPTNLIPKCPVCGRNMEMNLRADDRFVQDAGWFKHAREYQAFLDNAENKNLVLIEIGVGYNTPGIIKFPFERMTFKNKNTHLIRINKDYPVVSEEIENKTILFNENTERILKDLK